MPDLEEAWVAAQDATGGAGKFLRKYAAFTLLVIDEWLLDRLTESMQTMLLELMERRLRRDVDGVLHPVSAEGLVSICVSGGHRISPSGATGIAFGRRSIARAGTGGVRPRDWRSRPLAAGVLAHGVAAGLDPDRAVHDSVDESFGVNTDAVAPAPIPSRVLGSYHR
jgi:hypothetical protein